jgi:hypothetical protein
MLIQHMPMASLAIGFFPGTLSFDDPAVADEAIVPNFATPNAPAKVGMLSITDTLGRFSVS